MTRRQRWWDIATDEGRRAVGFLAGLAAVIYWVARGIRPDHVIAGLVASLLFAQAFIPTRSSERRADDRREDGSTGGDPFMADRRDNSRIVRDVGDRDLRTVAILR